MAILAIPGMVTILVMRTIVAIFVVVVCLYRSQGGPDVATGLGQRFASLVALFQHAAYVRTRARPLHM